MGIAKLKPEADPNLRAHNTEVPKETYKGIVADNSNTPVVSLQAYLDGMPWTVSYFKQLLGEHNDLRPLDVGGNAAAQQYEKFEALELKVATALTHSYDSEAAKSTVTGSAVIPIITPNIHDYFVSDAGSRQYGIYRVTNVERRTFNRDSVYLIDYQLVGYVKGVEDAYSSLELRTVRRFRFSKKRLIEGLSPILRMEEYELVSDFHRCYSEIVSEYMRDFFNRSYMTLVVPGQETAVYDVWMTDFFYSLIDPCDHPDIRNMRILSLEHDRYLKQGSLWKALSERRHDLLKRVNYKTHLVPREAFHTSTFLKGPSYWALRYYVYPKHPDMSSQVPGYPRPKDGGYISIVNHEGGMDTTDMDQINYYSHAGASLKIVKSVLVDDYYVFSEAFYSDKGDAEMSVLEILIKDYLKCHALDFNMLSALVANYHKWPALERFYYGPAIMLLLKTAVEGLYV